MYYKPKHFVVEEIFPPGIIAEHNSIGKLDQIWRLMDWRVLWTQDQLRERYGSMICNDYLWGGSNQYRVYRPAIGLIDWDYFRRFREVKAKWSSFTSQHCFGRASDSKFKKVTTEEVRQDIKRNPDHEAFRYITAVEDKVSWLHFDTRSWNRTESGILFF
ncbi:MAG: hypothetical protein PVG39_00165 [Desulfobacteraceae bacterium]